jgi:hypothetical protein
MPDMEMGCTRAELLDMIHQVLDANVSRQIGCIHRGYEEERVNG